MATVGVVFPSLWAPPPVPPVQPSPRLLQCTNIRGEPESPAQEHAEQHQADREKTDIQVSLSAVWFRGLQGLCEPKAGEVRPPAPGPSFHFSISKRNDILIIFEENAPGTWGNQTLSATTRAGPVGGQMAGLLFLPQ